MSRKTDKQVCHFCGATVPSTDAALAADWTPYLYVTCAGNGGWKEVGPCCLACHTKHGAFMDETEEWVVPASRYREPGNGRLPNDLPAAPAEG